MKEQNTKYNNLSDKDTAQRYSKLENERPLSSSSTLTSTQLHPALHHSQRNIQQPEDEVSDSDSGRGSALSEGLPPNSPSKHNGDPTKESNRNDIELDTLDGQDYGANVNLAQKDKKKGKKSKKRSRTSGLVREQGSEASMADVDL